MLINVGASQDKERHGRAEVHRRSMMTGRFESEKNGVKVSHGGLESRGRTGATEIKTKGKDEARKPPSNSERSKDGISQDLKSPTSPVCY